MSLLFLLCKSNSFKILSNYKNLKRLCVVFLNHKLLTEIAPSTGQSYPATRLIPLIEEHYFGTKTCLVGPNELTLRGYCTRRQIKRVEKKDNPAEVSV